MFSFIYYIFIIVYLHSEKDLARPPSLYAYRIFSTWDYLYKLVVVLGNNYRMGYFFLLSTYKILKYM